jgi:magnesium transporter
MRLEDIKKYPEDTDLLEDVIVENRQAMEMAKIYSDILAGTMDAFASIISNNQNIVMKFLTSVTIIISIPTMIASFYGMNVNVPFGDGDHTFFAIVALAFIVSLIAVAVMRKKKLF